MQFPFLFKSVIFIDDFLSRWFIHQVDRFFFALPIYKLGNTLWFLYMFMMDRKLFFTKWFMINWKSFEDMFHCYYVVKKFFAPLPPPPPIKKILRLGGEGSEICLRKKDILNHFRAHKSLCNWWKMFILL